MFTLKLFRRKDDGKLITRILAVDHLDVFEIGKHTLEIAARFSSDNDWNADTYFVGLRTPEMTALDDNNHYSWALLENWEGNTTQHFRPHTYG